MFFLITGGEYRAIRNQKNRSVLQDEATWQKKKLCSTNNPSDMWKAAKSMLGWSSGGPPTQLYHLGAYICSPSGLATTMNKFFLEKVRRLREGIPATNTDPLAWMKESMVNRSCSFSFNPVTVQQMRKTVDGLRSHWS